MHTYVHIHITCSTYTDTYIYTIAFFLGQAYLQSLGVRAEEWRVKQSDTEEWMQHRQLPEELRRRVRQYNQCKWIATRGVDEDSLLKSLPTDLHRDIKRHLCLNLVKKVLNARMNFVIFLGS